MTLQNQQQKKDLSLLRPFDLEKAKSGDKVCDASDRNTYVFVACSETQNSIYVQIIHYTHDTVYACRDYELRMKPLCWLEGKPVYKGDELWNKIEDLEDYNYIVDKHVDGQIAATKESKGSMEFLYNLSWTKREKEPKEKLPEVLHDVKKFKVGDKVKVVRVLPCGEYWDKGWGNNWFRGMDNYLHTICVVSGTSVAGVNLEHPYLAEFAFPSSVLELVEQPKDTQKKVKVLEVYLDGELIKKEEIEVE